MKIVVNCGYDHFGAAIEIDEFYDFVQEYEKDRTNPKLIEFVETHTDPDDRGDLRIIEIPDTATDWTINEYDEGCEEVIFVVDGKIHRDYIEIEDEDE